jgi:N-methylhydantoinase B
MGARPVADGLSGVHTHMTNSLNTPIEALEQSLPVRIARYTLRRGSGGAGRFRGGDGIVRAVEALVPAEVSILSDRRILAPYGLAGGAPGRRGRNTLRRAGERTAHTLPSKVTLRMDAGDVLTIETPGGGGHGRASSPRRRSGSARRSRG